MSAHDVRAKNFTVLLVTQDFHESFRLAGPACAAVGREGESARDIIELFLFALVLGQPDAGDFGMAVRYAGDVVIANRMRLLSGEQLRDIRAFAKSLVREHRRPGDVADCVVSWRAGLQILVDLDEAAIGELDPALLEADVLSVHRATRGHEHRGSRDLLLFAIGFDVEHDFVFADRGLGDLRAGDDIDPPFPIALRQDVGGFGVFDREDARQRFDQGDFDAERLKNVGKFHPHGTRSDNRE
jgi:hypothetical protein